MIQHFCEVASKGPVKQLAFILHGYGASAENIMGLGEYWKSFVPNTLFIAPNAPEFIASVYGFQWFPIGNLEESLLTAGCKKAVPTLAPFIKQMQEKHQISWQNTCLVGVSQGAMLVLYAALTQPHLCSKVIGYSGGVPMDPKDITTAPKDLDILLVHGMQDDVVPAAASQDAEKMLKIAGFSVSLNLLPHLDHSINERGLQLGQKFLVKSY